MALLPQHFASVLALSASALRTKFDIVQSKTFQIAHEWHHKAEEAHSGGTESSADLMSAKML